MGLGRKDKPPTGSLYPRESYVCFFIFFVGLAAAEKKEGFELDTVMCTTTRHVGRLVT